MMSKEKRKVPKLRFPGFTEDWEQRKLIDIAKTFIGLVTTMTENYRDSGTLLIRNSDIKEGQFLFSENPIHLDEEFAEKNKTRRLQIGDVVTVHTGDIGTSAVIEEKEAGAIGFATINTRTDKSILNPYFLATYFNTEKHKCYANSVSTGDGRSNYNIKDFNNLVISVPTLDEQERISVLINDINIIITLHQRKLDNLKLKKKALLQKLFPKNGEHYPELRFPGFTDAWEQRKLNDLVTIRRGLTYKPSDIAENGIRVLRSSNIDEDQFITSNDDVFVNIEAVNIPFAKNGDILITSANGSNRLVGKHTIIRDIADNSAVHGGFMLLAESNNPLFTDALLSSNWYKRFINTYVAGGNGAIGNLSKSDLESQTVMVPSEHEQAKIGQWYDNINQLITLHQRKLDHLQLQKKALLQQMFV